MITYIAEILEWQTLKKKRSVRPSVRLSCHSSADWASAEGEHVEWIKMISERVHHHTVEILTGSMLTDPQRCEPKRNNSADF